MSEGDETHTSIIVCADEDTMDGVMNRLQPYQKAIVDAPKYSAIGGARKSLTDWANGEYEKEIAKALKDATELFDDIARDAVNHQDEAEKWLRAYGHLCPPNS